MSFDDMGKEIAGTLSGVFGGLVTFERPEQHSSEITAVIRSDAETVDEAGQVTIIDHVVRFAHSDVPFMPKRGDTVCRGSELYTLGRRLSDNGFFVEYEASK